MADNLLYPPQYQTRMEDYFANPPQLENSYYGVYNALLHSFFGVNKGFIIKPQHILRPTVAEISSIYLPANEGRHPDTTRVSSRVAQQSQLPSNIIKTLPPDGYSLNVSTDSLNDRVMSASESGSEDGLGIVDFSVCKGTADLHDDTLICLVEIKLTTDNLAQAIRQVEGYLDIIASKRLSPHFRAFLCIGDQTYMWTSSQQGGDVIFCMKAEPIETCGVEFFAVLRQLRDRHIN